MSTQITYGLGSGQLLVTYGLGSSQSAVIIISAVVIDSRRVRITFSDAVSRTEALFLPNWSINLGIGIRRVEYVTDNTYDLVLIQSLLPLITYTATANNMIEL